MKRFQRVLMLIGVVISLVFIVFTFQHRLIYETYAVNERWNSENEDMTIQIRNISVKKFQTNTKIGNKPWYFSVSSLIHKAPDWVYSSLFRVGHFLSTPHQLDKGTVAVSGVAYGDDPFRDHYDVNVSMDKPTYYSNSFRTTTGNGSNVTSFSAEIEDVPVEHLNDISFTVKVIKDGELLKEYKVNGKPQRSIIYDFINEHPQPHLFSPEDYAIDFVSALKDGNRGKAEELVYASARKSFPWKNVYKDLENKDFVIGIPFAVHEGNYLGFENVFSVTLEYKERSVEKTNQFVSFAKQKVFLIETGENEWKIIYLQKAKFNKKD